MLQTKYCIKNLLNSNLKNNQKRNQEFIRSVARTKRNLETRVKEHFRNIKNEEIEKPTVAAHLWKEKKYSVL